MDAWERFKQRAIHHNEQHAAFMRDALESVKKKRRKQFIKAIQTGEAPPDFWKWLQKKKKRLLLMERILRADGLVSEIMDMTKEDDEDA